MPARTSARRSIFDPVNLLLIGAAIVITFLPLGIALVVNQFQDGARPIAAPPSFVTVAAHGTTDWSGGSSR